ncbi:MAG: ThuA domain-containing protein [Acidobacteria bacterium]|nr:ThuA domain-containing protein [Acidobacteriota bacterium]
MIRCFLQLACCFTLLGSSVEAKRILFVTHTAGYRHDSIPVAIQAMQEMAARTEKLEVVATEDLSLLSAEGLRDFDAVFFFTSGELDLSPQQKADLLEFVRSGKGFGGAHCATDTFYTWPEYGEMIGAYFDGHPWAQEVNLKVEDPAFPGLETLEGGFRIVDEIYQFRNFSRERVRVLLSLDTSTVDLNAPGVARTDGDFALAWVRPYGAGRVFYTALGHFDWSWTDERAQKVLTGALLWLTGEVEADATPR